MLSENYYIAQHDWLSFPAQVAILPSFEIIFCCFRSTLFAVLVETNQHNLLSTPFDHWVGGCIDIFSWFSLTLKLLICLLTLCLGCGCFDHCHNMFAVLLIKSSTVPCIDVSPCCVSAVCVPVLRLATKIFYNFWRCYSTTT